MQGYAAAVRSFDAGDAPTYSLAEALGMPFEALWNIHLMWLISQERRALATLRRLFGDDDSIASELAAVWDQARPISITQLATVGFLLSDARAPATPLRMSPWHLALRILSGKVGRPAAEIIVGQTTGKGAANCNVSPGSEQGFSHISEERLRRDVEDSFLNDMQFSPKYQHIAHVMGASFESLLSIDCRLRGLSFLTESDLRALQMQRTPDVVLTAPLTASDGRSVSWVDSKALFGSSAHCASEAFSQQLESYASRWGPGLVVFWYGLEGSLRGIHPAGMFSSQFQPDTDTLLSLPGDRVDHRRASTETSQ